MVKEKSDFRSKFIIVCLLLIWSPIILFSLFIFAGHGFEPIISALHLREMNRMDEPLAIGETWSEKHFDFTLTDITDLSRREMEDDVRTYSINFKLENESLKMSGYDVYACANDENGDMIKCPLPDDSAGSFAYDEEYTLVFMIPPETDHVDITVMVPYSDERYYKNQYRFYLP